MRPGHVPEAMLLAVAGTKAGRRNVGPATVRRIHATLRSALGTTKRKRLIAYNPAADIELPKAPRPTMRPWEPEELGKFLDHSAAYRLGSLYEIVALTGLRRGEICGLRWQDAERVQWGGAWTDTGFVFAREDGRALHPETVTKHFRRLTLAAGLRPVRLHDLRHGQASLMLAAGVSIAVVSKRLGRSSIAITSDTYSHMLEGVGSAAANAAANLISRSSPHTCEGSCGHSATTTPK